MNSSNMDRRRKPKKTSPRNRKKGKGGNIVKVTKNNKGGAIASAVIIGLMLIAGYIYMRYSDGGAEEVKISEAMDQITDENTEDVYTQEDKLYFEVKEDADDLEKGEYFAYVPEDTDVYSLIQDEGIEISDIEGGIGHVPVTNIPWSDILSIGLLGLLAFGVFLFVKNMQSSGGRLLDFGRSKARLIFGKKSEVGFDDVAGIKESKEELQEIVQFLKKPKKFTRLGARIPKGVLLVGPPGSGKTLLAKAVAGESKVPFFHTSGSEFEEMLVGAGASRVRDLFEKARKAAPCIIFIDEIDAVAKKRGTTIHSGNTEQTLNQILVEMDGLEPRTNVIVIAATNRPDVLDPAILRPGRFDRNVVLRLPDASEREKILEIHAKNKKLADDVDLSKIARRTVGYSGADLENTLNEAAILAAKNNQDYVTEKDLDEAALKVKYGPERKSRKRAEKDLEMTAYHEAGHALVARYTPDSDPVHGVSIISRGMAGGMTIFLPEKDRERLTRNQMLARIKVSAGGNVAEKIIFNDVSTGAAEDIKNATETAKDMVKKYGMSDKLGFVQYENLDEMQYMGYGYDVKDYSDATARDIDLEVKSIIDGSWNKVEDILTEHKDKLVKLAELLLEKEVLDSDEFDDFFKQYEDGKEDENSNGDGKSKSSNKKSASKTDEDSDK